MANINDQKDLLFNVDLIEYIDILKKQKGFILVFCLSAILSSLALTYIFSEKYMAGTTIYYRPTEVSTLRQKEMEAFGAPVPAPSFKVIKQTLWDILKSEVVLRATVEKLNLQKPIEIYYPIWYERWYHATKDFVKENLSNLWIILKHGRLIEEDPTVIAVKTLRENVDIIAGKESYLYILAVKDKYPQRAGKIVDTLGEILVEWLKKQDINPSENKLALLLRRLSEKEKEIKNLRMQRKNLLEKKKIVLVFEEASEGIESTYQMKLAEVELNAEIEKLKKKLTQYQYKLKNKNKLFINPDDVKKLKSNKLFGEIELEGLLEKREAIRVSIRKLNQRIQELPSLDNEIKNLDMLIEANTREYFHLKDSYLDVLGQMEIVQGEVKVMHQAVISAKPVQPIKIYHVGATTILSIFLSTGLIYVFAFFNIRIFFSLEEVEESNNSLE